MHADLDTHVMSLVPALCDELREIDPSVSPDMALKSLYYFVMDLAHAELDYCDAASSIVLRMARRMRNTTHADPHLDWTTLELWTALLDLCDSPRY